MWGREYLEVVVRKTTHCHRETEQLEEPFRHEIALHVRRRSVCSEQREVARLQSRRAPDGQFRIVQPVNLSAGQKSRGDTPVREGGSQAVEILRVPIR